MRIAIGNVLSSLGLIVAIVFGIFAQSISYFLNEHYPSMELQTYITILTITSIILFIVIPFFSFIVIRVKNQISKILALLSIGLGIPISMWSFFVWAMWMG